MSRDHRKLRAFELADELVIGVYELTRRFPKDELFGLTSQMRRAAVSVAANIVEGAGRSSHKEYVQFLSVSFASLRELGYFLSLVPRLGLVSPHDVQTLEQQHAETSRTLAGLLRSLTQRAPSTR